jgi:hypothetical protein
MSLMVSASQRCSTAGTVSRAVIGRRSGRVVPGVAPCRPGVKAISGDRLFSPITGGPARSRRRTGGRLARLGGKALVGRLPGSDKVKIAFGISW